MLLHLYAKKNNQLAIFPLMDLSDKKRKKGHTCARLRPLSAEAPIPYIPKVIEAYNTSSYHINITSSS